MQNVFITKREVNEFFNFQKWFVEAIGQNGWVTSIDPENE